MNFENANQLIYPAGTDTKALRLFAYNQDVIRSYLPTYSKVNSEKLFKGLTAYLIYNYDSKCDLFGFTEIDLKELCRDYLGTTVNNLNSKLELEESFSYQEIRNKLYDRGYRGEDLEKKLKEEISRIKSMQDYELIFFDNVIDDFLNRLLTKKIKYNMVIKNNENTIYENSAHSFLDAIKIVQDRNNKNKKRYLIKLSDFYIRSLNMSFLFQKSTVIKTLLKESKGNTRPYDLYCFLTSLKEKCRVEKLNAYKVPFETLVSQLNLFEIKSPASKKHKINKYLEEVKGQCNHLEFEYKWIKNTNESKYNYALYLVFDLKGYNSLDLFKVKEKDFNNLVKFYYYNLYLHIKNLVFIETEDQKNDFENWVNNKKLNFDEKIDRFSKAFYEIYNIPLKGYFRDGLYYSTMDLNQKFIFDLKDFISK